MAETVRDGVNLLMKLLLDYVRSSNGFREMFGYLQL